MNPPQDETFHRHSSRKDKLDSCIQPMNSQLAIDNLEVYSKCNFGVQLKSVARSVYATKTVYKTNFVESKTVNEPLLAAYFVCLCVAILFTMYSAKARASFCINVENPSKSLNV